MPESGRLREDRFINFLGDRSGCGRAGAPVFDENDDYPAGILDRGIGGKPGVVALG
jgi:hypothetical protein